MQTKRTSSWVSLVKFPTFNKVVVAVDVAVVITAIKMATLPENAPNKDRSATRSILSIIHGRGVPPTKATPTF